jgi:uncharacterized membrane protein YvbJ
MSDKNSLIYRKGDGKMFCPKCGASLENGAKFCKECGGNLIQEQTVNTPLVEPVIAQQTMSAKPIEPKPQDTHTSNQTPQANSVALDKPLSVLQYLGIFLLSIVPIVGIVFIFIWAFGSSVNINKKNYCRAVLIMALISIVLSIIISITFGALLASIFEFSNYIPIE